MNLAPVLGSVLALLLPCPGLVIPTIPLGLGTRVPGLAMGNHDIHAIGSWAGQSGYLGLGTRVPGLATGGNPDT